MRLGHVYFSGGSPNRYAIRARISENQFWHIVRFFALDLAAIQISALAGLNRNTINRYLRGIRKRIAEYCERQSPFFGEIEVDESYFGAKRIKGKRGREFELMDTHTRQLGTSKALANFREHLGRQLSIRI